MCGHVFIFCHFGAFSKKFQLHVDYSNTMNEDKSHRALHSLKWELTHKGHIVVGDAHKESEVKRYSNRERQQVKVEHGKYYH